mmetsp:Transcript_58993/g.140865  ORF Transcript_58993/g.140865 Transcript_58993/m.140865 type:complete len:146 (+) Transcript_58993:106-543(+)
MGCSFSSRGARAATRPSKTPHVPHTTDVSEKSDSRKPSVVYSSTQSTRAPSKAPPLPDCQHVLVSDIFTEEDVGDDFSSMKSSRISLGDTWCEHSWPPDYRDSATHSERLDVFLDQISTHPDFFEKEMNRVQDERFGTSSCTLSL